MVETSGLVAARAIPATSRDRAMLTSRTVEMSLFSRTS